MFYPNFLSWVEINYEQNCCQLWLLIPYLVEGWNTHKAWVHQARFVIQIECQSKQAEVGTSIVEVSDRQSFWEVCNKMIVGNHFQGFSRCRPKLCKGTEYCSVLKRTAQVFYIHQIMCMYISVCALADASWDCISNFSNK